MIEANFDSHVNRNSHKESLFLSHVQHRGMIMR